MLMFLILLSQGQKTEAERYFLKAIQLDPTKGNCYMHYGKICVFPFNLTYPDSFLPSQLFDLPEWDKIVKMHKERNLHIFSRLYGRQCLLTLLLLLPLNILNLSLYKNPQEERMISLHCSLPFDENAERDNFSIFLFCFEYFPVIHAFNSSSTDS